MNEFALIRRFFGDLTPLAAEVALGIGDDCALLRPPPGEEIALTTDTLVAGRHFAETGAAADIGWKALAVNLSDLAAMGARPLAFLLSLTLPEYDEVWLSGFAEGLGELAALHEVALVGGNTARGPLSITITAVGAIPVGAAMLRGGALAGDVVCVTGTLGDAALALAVAGPRQNALADDPFLARRLHRPSPRVAAGIALRPHAHAAIDLSDGLAGDLGHVLAASGVGADIEVGALPASAEFLRFAAPARRLELQAAGGDDYELCVCLPPDALNRIRLDVPLTPIGRVTAGPGLRWVDAERRRVDVLLRGYDHFA
jgi:thiamine-monophosphate kinase